MVGTGTDYVGKTDKFMDADSPTNDLERDLRGRLLALQQRSLADTSQRQYAATWKQWSRFSLQIDRSPWLQHDDSRAQSLQLILFATYSWSSRARPLAIDTVYAKLSHVKWYHRVYAGFEPQLSSGHDAALAGMRRLSSSPGAKAPLSTVMLQWICNAVDFDKAHHRLVLGAALLGFFFLLRSSEYLGVKGGYHRYAIRVRDFEVQTTRGLPASTASEADSVVITLRGSKTDQQGSGTSRRLYRSGHPTMCPVVGAMLLLDLAARNGLHPSDPLCSWRRSRILRAVDLAKIIKFAASANGADPALYSSHSLRSGGATALIAAGCDSTTIKLHGRWRSNAFQRYTRYSDRVGSSLATMMVAPSTVSSSGVA